MNSPTPRDWARGEKIFYFFFAVFFVAFFVVFLAGFLAGMNYLPFKVVTRSSNIYHQKKTKSMGNDDPAYLRINAGNYLIIDRACQSGKVIGCDTITPVLP